MRDATQQVDLNKVLSFFKKILEKKAPDALSFIEKKTDSLLSDKSNLTYFIAFSTLPQHVKGKETELSKEEIKEAATLRQQWDISNWTLEQIARVYLMLTFAKLRPDDFKTTLDKLIGTSDAHELITLYQAFPLFPHPESLMLHATNGIRCNMISAFNAIALNNPYPAEFFDNIAWNQLVLKTLFVESPIEKITGLKHRANLALTHALINTVRERQAAHRSFRPEIWYLIGISADKDVIDQLKNFLKTDSEILQQGALLALHNCQLPEAKELINHYSKQYNNTEVQSNLEKLRTFEQSLLK